MCVIPKGKTDDPGWREELLEHTKQDGSLLYKKQGIAYLKLIENRYKYFKNQ